MIVKNDKGVPYLYIDGGEITTWDGNGDGLQPVSGNGSETTGNFTTVPGAQSCHAQTQHS